VWFVRLDLKVAIADINAGALETLAKELVAAHGETNVLAVPTDVSKLEDVVRLRERVYEAWGEVSVVRRGLPSPSPSPQVKGKDYSPLPPLCPAVALSPAHTLNLVFRLPYCSIMLRLRIRATRLKVWITGRP